MTENKSNTSVKGILYACAAFGLFAAMAMFNKLLAGQHHAIEVSFYRNLISIIPFGGYFLVSKNYQALKIKRPFLLSLRCIVGTLGMFATLMATQMLPLSYATVLFFVSTLVVPIIATVFLGEKIGLHRIAAIVVGMSGVIIVAQPSGEASAIGLAVGLIAGVTHAVIQSSLRGLREENPEAINLYFFASAFVISALFMPWLYSPVTMYSALVLLAISVVSIAAHFCLARAFKYAQASIVSPFNYTGLLWATLFDVTIWGLWPDMNVWVGAALIICSSLYILYREQRAKKAASV